MKIVFNGGVSCLGPNGGSRTILLSAKTLELMGHTCEVVSPIDNFKWFDHKQTLKSIPNDADVIINIAAIDYVSTINSSIPKKFCWWRAHEAWSNTEEQLRDYYLDKHAVNIVNSVGLQRQLSALGAESFVVYQGIDFEFWKDKALRSKDKIRIGALYTKQSRKRWSDFVELSKILGHDDYDYVGIGNVEPEEDFLVDFACNVGPDRLSDVYSSCHIWFAPTDSEGLHNVPMEANLCGCLIVCADEPLNGMIHDYAFDKNTSMVYDRKDIEHAASLIRNPDWALVKNMQSHLKTVIGDRKTNMERLINILEG